jgi:hypothetical protein
MSNFSGRLQSDLIADLWPYCDANVPLTGWLSNEDYAARALLSSFYKKFVEKEDPRAEQLALDKFLQVNSACLDYKMPSEISSVSASLVGEVKSFLYKFLLDNGLPCLTFATVLDRARMGPGASVLATGDDFYSKLFSSRLSCTKLGLYTAFTRYFGDNPLWRCAELLRSYSYGDPSIVRGNRLSFVPKTNETRRTICTEPSLNMFFQLGLGEWISERLRDKLGLDLATQPDKNRRLAKVGSRSGRYFSLDLSSASDSLSLGMIRELFPRDFVAWLELFRSPESTLPDGRIVNLGMVSTMGNGFTFPLQTLLFSACVIACYRVHGIKYRNPCFKTTNCPTFGVFGDDILADRRIYRSLVSLLTLLGFTVNHDKTFFEGPFRESCGGDYLRGRDVRGVYVKSLSTPQARCVVLNRLNVWSGKTGIPLQRTIHRLLMSVPKQYVPLWEQDDAGIRVPRKVLRGYRWSKRYQSLLYRRWLAKPPTLEVSDVVKGPRGYRRRIFNPWGLEISFLYGGIVSGRISLRDPMATRYTTKTGVAPSWDYTAEPGINRVELRHLNNGAVSNMPLLA